MSTTPKINFEYLVEGQSNAEVVLNEWINVIDTLLQLAFIDRDLSAAPGSPTNGDCYLVSGTPAGGDAWEGEGGNIAAYYDGWLFITPKEGFRAWVNDENILIAYDGASWSAV